MRCQSIIIIITLSAKSQVFLFRKQSTHLFMALKVIKNAGNRHKDAKIGKLSFYEGNTKLQSQTIRARSNELRN